MLRTEELSISFGTKKVVKSVSLKMDRNKVLAIIGPSGCGKSTFLRAINRMHDFTPEAIVEGKVFFEGKNIFVKREIHPIELRQHVGMLFQKPNPFPKSIYKNIEWALKLHGFANSEIPGRIEQSLKRVALWDEVSTRLKDEALDLSGGQQQRLCLARSLALEPELLLMDEPCSALDPKSTAKIEELIKELKQSISIVIVTHNMGQAQRVADETAFFLSGKLIEMGPTSGVFHTPQHKETRDYVSGKFG
ncbi:MAG: phosphate ABC transporter ATP-binding protein PstB [Bdellovibrionota bacterium]